MLLKDILQEKSVLPDAFRRRAASSSAEILLEIIKRPFMQKLTKEMT